MLETLPAPPHRAKSIESFNNGVRAYRGGQPDIALKAWKHAATTDAALTPALYNLAVHAELNGTPAEAAEAWARCVDADPYDTRALVRRSVALARANDLEGAVRSLEAAIRVYPYFRFWYDDLARMLERLGRNGEATMWRERGGKLDADAVEMALDDGIRNLRSGNWDLARVCFEAILEDWPENVEAHIRLAQALAGAGDPSAGVDQLGHALPHADTNTPRVFYHRARLHLMAGDPVAAGADLREALRRDGNYGVAIDLLQRVRMVTEGEAAGAGDSRTGTGATMGFHPHHRNDSSVSDPPGAAGIDYPVFHAPDPTLPWEERVRALVRQASLLPGPTGRPPRFALLLERNVALAPLAARVIESLSGPELPKMPDGAQPVFVVEANAAPATDGGDIARFGWLGSDVLSTVDVMRWPEASEPIPVDVMLQTLLKHAANEAFNLVLLVCSGQVRDDQGDTGPLVRRVSSYQFALVAPHARAHDVSLRFQGIAPNWVEIGA